MNKVNVINPEIVVHGTLEKPYYEVQYYDVDDNAWKIGYSSYDLSIVCRNIRDYFNIIEQGADFQPIKHGRWLIREKDKLVPTGKVAVSEGHILSKTSSDEPFTLQSANLIQIKKHRTVKMPYCSICGNYGDDEYDKTPYCPSCGAKMNMEDEDNA